MRFFTLNFSTRIKIVAILVVTFIIFLVAYLIYQNISYKKNEYLNLLQKEEHTEILKSILSLKTEQLEKISIDYACYDWMVHFIEQPNLDEAKENITPVGPLGLTFIQIYNLKKQSIYIDISKQLKDTVNIPAEVFIALLKERCMNFHLYTKQGIFQVAGSTVHPSSDLQRVGQPMGFIMMGELWDKNYFEKLEQLTGSKINLYKPIDYKPKNIAYASYVSLNTYDNKVAALLEITKNNPYAVLIKNLNSFFDTFFLITIILILIITILAFNILIIKPLGHIIYSLDTVSPEKLLKTAIRGDEFGKISRFLLEFFSQKEMLQNKLVELNLAKDDLNNLNFELQAQKEELQASSERLLKANDEITESIKYASIIQYAVLSAPASFYATFPEHFIIYKPKSIISGDFYWIKEKESRFYVVCADCTGHSLAGALLSMMGISFLNDILHQQTKMTAAEIMNYLRKYFVEALNQTGAFGEAHGGMDIVLCIIDPVNSKLEYASAFNTFYIVTKNSQSNERQLLEFKGDAMPVGIYVKKDFFSNHIIDINTGDMIYLFSDGFIDQFGGINNKKYRSNNFKELLLTASVWSSDEQKEMIDTAFENWRGSNQQTDDILVMGIRYNPITV